MLPLLANDVEKNVRMIVGEYALHWACSYTQVSGGLPERDAPEAVAAANEGFHFAWGEASRELGLVGRDHHDVARAYFQSVFFHEDPEACRLAREGLRVHIQALDPTNAN
jgi:hypothetical protein